MQEYTGLDPYFSPFNFFLGFYLEVTTSGTFYLKSTYTHYSLSREGSF